MAVPKKKTSSSVRGMRNSHNSRKYMSAISYIIDKASGLSRRNHHVGPDGTYKGRKVVDSKYNESLED